MADVGDSSQINGRSVFQAAYQWDLRDGSRTWP